MDNLLYERDASMAIYVPEIDTYYFMSSNTTIAPGEIPAEAQGRKAIVTEKGKVNKWIELPINGVNDNVLTRNIEVSVTPETDGFAIEQNVEAKGTMKEFYNNFVPDIYADRCRFEQMGEVADTLFSEFRMVSYNKNSSQLNAKQEENIDKLLKEDLKDYYNTSDYQLIDNKIKSIGYDPQDPVFRMSTNLILRDGAVSRAGRNTVVNIGRLIPHSFHYSKSLKKDRIADVVYPNGARTLAFNIRFQIPAGMTVAAADLKALETNVKNECGQVISKASVADGVLTVNVNIAYNNPREKAENWSKVLELVDAQLAFQKAQITLRKGK